MPTERRLPAIMFADIVAYTAPMARNEEAARDARDRQGCFEPAAFPTSHGFDMSDNSPR